MDLNSLDTAGLADLAQQIRIRQSEDALARRKALIGVENTDHPWLSTWLERPAPNAWIVGVYFNGDDTAVEQISALKVCRTGCCVSSNYASDNMLMPAMYRKCSEVEADRNERHWLREREEYERNPPPPIDIMNYMD